MGLHPELRTISLCTGGGGLDIGVDIALSPCRPVVMVEREAFACASLVQAMRQGLLAPAPVWSDVGSFNGRAWRGVDGVYGGIPCQPHSTAGKRLGQEDERDLWSDARRIIVQSRAWWVLIENVEGMLSSGGAYRVRRDLLRMGFDVEGGLFSASEVGASHERSRLFILGVRSPAVGVGLADPDCSRSQGIGSERHDEGSAGLCSREAVADADDIGRRSEGLGGEQSEVSCSRRAALADAPDDLGGRGICRAETGARHDGIGGRGSAVSSGSLDDASGVRRGEGRPEPSVLGRGHSSSGPDDGLGDTFGGGGGRRADEPQREPVDGTPAGRPGERDGLSMFPPGPSDINGWRGALARSPELEPAFRRMADGVAPWLVDARIDRLRLLGNGVVPIQAGYALRTLITRLAARGSRGAARLVPYLAGETDEPTA